MVSIQRDFPDATLNIDLDLAKGLEQVSYHPQATESIGPSVQTHRAANGLRGSDAATPLLDTETTILSDGPFAPETDDEGADRRGGALLRCRQPTCLDWTRL
jgi:hypothetical protein